MVRRGDGGQGCGAHWVCFRRTLPGWWNGRHGALKMLCPKGRAGSSPALGTKTWVPDLRNAEQGPLSCPLPAVVHCRGGPPGPAHGEKPVLDRDLAYAGRKHLTRRQAPSWVLLSGGARWTQRCTYIRMVRTPYPCHERPHPWSTTWLFHVV